VVSGERCPAGQRVTRSNVDLSEEADEVGMRRNTDTGNCTVQVRTDGVVYWCLAGVCHELVE